MRRLTTIGPPALAVLLLAGCPAAPEPGVTATRARGIPDLPSLADADASVRSHLADLHAQAAAAPDDAGAVLALGTALHANDRPDAALTAYRTGLALDPTEARAWHLLGLLERDAGRLDDAAAAFRTAAAHAPDYAPARWRLGFVRLDQGRTDDAEVAFRAALAIAPGDAAARLGLARAALARGDADAALEALDGPDAEFGGNAGYAAHLRGRALRRAGRPAPDATAVPAPPVWRDPWLDAVHALRRGYGADVRRAESLLRAGAFADAKPLLDRLHGQHPDDVAVAVNRALARRETGDVAGSLALLDDVLRVHPDHVAARFQAAVGLARRATEPNRPDAEGLRRQAEAHLDHVIALNPGHAFAHGLRGDLLLMVRDTDGAFARYEDASRVAPDDPGWSWRAGLCLVMAGRNAEAIPWLERTLVLAPDHAEAQAALKHARAAIEVGPREGGG